MITYTIEVTFEPKPYILKWPWLEEARMNLAVWLIRLGLRVSGSEEMILTSQLIGSTREEQVADEG